MAGSHNLRDQARPAFHLLSDEEEGRAGAALGESLEHRTGALRVRAVVEGETDGPLALDRATDPKCGPGLSAKGRRGRRRVGEGGRGPRGHQPPTIETEPHR
jgi:hypothetical protein